MDSFARPAQALQNELELGEVSDADGKGVGMLGSPIASPTSASVAPGQPYVTLTPIQPDRQRESFELSCARTEKVSIFELSFFFKSRCQLCLYFFCINK